METPDQGLCRDEALAHARRLLRALAERSGPTASQWPTSVQNPDTSICGRLTQVQPERSALTDGMVAVLCLGCAVVGLLTGYVVASGGWL
jgi:hypothetical protein